MERGYRFLNTQIHTGGTKKRLNSNYYNVEVLSSFASEICYHSVFGHHHPNVFVSRGINCSQLEEAQMMLKWCGG